MLICLDCNETFTARQAEQSHKTIALPYYSGRWEDSSEGESVPCCPKCKSEDLNFATVCDMCDEYPCECD